jgi:predicted nucleic acid-binding protein
MAVEVAAPGGVLAGVLVDSDVLIWTLRGNARALAKIENLPDWHISAVSYMELAQGCRNKTELKAMQKAFKSETNEVLPITQSISELACLLVEEHALSHSLYMADALIAATAISHSLPLLTANGKHFSAVAQLKLQVFKP